MPTVHTGRKSIRPTTAHGQFIHDRLIALRISRSQLAERLGVSNATITRLLNGHVAAGTVNLDRLCTALRITEMERRDFLKLIGVAIIAPKPVLEQLSVPAHSVAPLALRRSGVDFDEFHAALDLCAEGLQGNRDPRNLLSPVQRISDKLARLQDAGRVSAADPAFVEISVRTGMLLGALQETVLGWWKERPLISGETYWTLAEEVFPLARSSRSNDPRTVMLRTEHARLDLRRAVLLREGKQLDECDALLYALKDQFHIERLLSDPQGAVAIVAYACQRVHTLAVENRYQDWETELKRTRDYVADAAVSDAMRQRLRGIVAYTVGVGYKRFMWHYRKRDSLRTSFAEKAYRTLKRLRESGDGGQATHDINLYHASIPLAYVEPELETSEIDALLWLNPQAAFEQTMALRVRVASTYPSLLTKLDEQITLSQELRGLDLGARSEEIQAWHARRERRS